MHSALLSDKKVITAKAYEEAQHGVILTCMDKSCDVPVFYIKGTEEIIPHFKTSGKGDSVHKESCGFAKKLSFQESVAKVSEYQASLREQGIREFIVKLNMNSIDPDFESKAVERDNNKDDEPKEKSELDDKSLKESPGTPQSISSLKSVKKLFTTVEPDLLASIIVSVKGGKRIPISELIRHYTIAHEALWDMKTLDVPYFIHGKIQKVIRREKVWYINFSNTESCMFSLVLFDRHFKHFTKKDEELVGKEVLAFGYLKKNEFIKERKGTEMIIKSDKYIEYL